MGMRLPFARIVSTPLPQRNEGNDATNYAQPLVVEYFAEPYQTYWMGNQIPGVFIHTQSNANYWPVSSLDPIMPQRQGGSFGQVLGQVQSSSLVARMHQLWSAAKSRY